MTDPQMWIVIPNWRGEKGFQHYRDRVPTWIKNYVELMSDDAYLGLTGHQRGVLHGIWLEYASARCQLALDTGSLTRRLNLRVTTDTLEALSHAGFIRVSASKPLAEPYKPASPEKRREEENPPTPLPGGLRRTSEERRETKKAAKPPRYLAGVQPIWNQAPADEREHDARVWLEGFTSDTAEIERHLDHLRTQEAA